VSPAHIPWRTTNDQIGKSATLVQQAGMGAYTGAAQHGVQDCISRVQLVQKSSLQVLTTGALTPPHRKASILN